MKSNRSRNRAAFSLLELSLALAVIVILLLALAQGGGIRNQARVMTAAESIRTLRTAAEGFISGGNLTYTGVSLTELKNKNLLPGGFSGTGSNPWGGNYNIAVNAGDATKVDITVTAVPDDAGAQLNTLFKNSAGSTSYDAGTDIWTGTF